MNIVVNSLPRRKPSRLQLLRRHMETYGFDTSERRGNQIRVGCSQCQPSVINGVPCHERNCPNEVHECRGCNALISMHQSYCEDCCL
jgi:hypothetical protein